MIPPGRRNDPMEEYTTVFDQRSKTFSVPLPRVKVEASPWNRILLQNIVVVTCQPAKYRGSATWFGLRPIPARTTRRFWTTLPNVLNIGSSFTTVWTLANLWADPD